MDFEKLLKPMQKSSIRIAKSAIGECPVGSSKIGGKPDLPADFHWYYYQGKSYEETMADYPPGAHAYFNREDAKYNAALPLSFLAQINCEEVHEYDTDGLLPSKGMLYFFYEAANMTWGFDPNDKGSAKVYFHPEISPELHRTDFPPDLSEEYQLPEMPITFSAAKELPAFEEFTEWHDEELEHGDWQRYDETKVEMGFDSELEGNATEGMIAKLLGYANLIQNGMLLSCEQVTNGIYCGDPVEIPEDRLCLHKENAKNWQLLFQLDSIRTDTFEMLWGDVGRIYFYIRIEDLKNMNFDNCWLLLQC